MRYFFVGIGGVSMSALAKLLLAAGHKVSGSDAVASVNTRELQTLGIPVYIGHSAEHVRDIDRLVINGAITDDNPELRQAQADGIKIVYREQVLATVARRYQQVLAVAGCHGKSSTTAMLGAIFQKAGQEPTVHNGAKDNLHLGGREFFITEACEFRRSFLKLKPKVAIITNVDADHLDCYRDLDDIKHTFAKFAAKADIVIKNATDPNSDALRGKKQTITFGLPYGDVHAVGLHSLPNGGYAFGVAVNPAVFGTYCQSLRLTLSVPGLHNVANALAAVACALVYRLPFASIHAALSQFNGVARRFEQLGKIGQTPLILDYAHHPREIVTTLQTASMLYRRYLLVFQPHTYTRTLALWDDFVKVLGTVENLVLYKTYAARGKVIVGGRALDLSRNLGTKYFATTDKLKKYLLEQAPHYDAVILCGAGDVVNGEFMQDVLQ